MSGRATADTANTSLGPVPATASVVWSENLEYPLGEDGFSPATRYPEYPFDHLSSRPNAVYGMVRDVMAQAGWDEEHLGTGAWNPLGRFIKPGSRVFVLCNFVYHRKPQDTKASFLAKCIHASVLRPILDYALIAAGRCGAVRFGNAPLQSCVWERVLEGTGADRVVELYRRLGVAVRSEDLRLFVAERDFFGRVTRSEARDAAGRAVEIDLRDDSLLSALPGRNERSPRFRVSDYDPRRTDAFHAGGSHRYIVHRSILESDVVISLSKLKTHEKVGITCGLKGFVGTVAHKDCLAHHRLGGPSVGGDEYPYGWPMLNGLSALHDWVNKGAYPLAARGALQVLDRSIRRTVRRLGIPTAGAWIGNDTAWRMALDLARIVHYADVGGVMRETPQRAHLSFIDGIIAGEGNGPLSPLPVQGGTVILSDNVALGDRIACRCMGYDPARITLVREASLPSKYSIAPGVGENATIQVNGRTANEADLKPRLGRPFRPPMGWKQLLDSAR